MARPVRFQSPGAIYHVMARGDGGKAVFETDDDRKSLVFRLGQVCASHGWRIHAWVLMGNHFHLLLETPQANLVTVMQWLLGTFSQGWNRARLRRGHVFQGRYKSVPVTGTDADAYYLGKANFKERLLKLLEKTGQASGGTRNRTGEALREHGEAETERIVRRVVKILGLPVTAAAMAKLPKSDERKVTLAALLRDRTNVGNSWIARRLAMGHSGSVSRMTGSCRKSGELTSTVKLLAKTLDEASKQIQM